MAPRSEPAGLVRAANCAMAAPAPSPRLAAASTAAPPVASAAASSVRRSKRARSRLIVAPSRVVPHVGPPAPCPPAPPTASTGPPRRSTRPSHGLDERRVVVPYVTDARPDGMVHHGARRRGPQQRAQLLDVLVGRVEPEVEGGR